MADALAHRFRHLICYRATILFSRRALGARLRVSSLLLARSSRAVEARNFLPAMGCAGTFRLRRAPLCFLSAGVVDAWGRPQRSSAVDRCIQRLYLVGPGSRGRVYVHAGTEMAEPPRRHLRGRTLCRQPIPPGDRLLAERVRRIARQLSAPAI